MRMFRPSGIVDRSYDHMSVRTIPLSGCMDRRSRYMTKVSRYFYRLIILNFEFEIITVPQIDFRITSSLSFYMQ